MTNPSETKLVERWRKQLQDVGGWDNELAAVPAGGVRKMIEEFATALASLADELRLAQTELKGCYRIIDELKEELRLGAGGTNSVTAIRAKGASRYARDVESPVP